jgi:outer membrane protein assembly factor BamA
MTRGLISTAALAFLLAGFTPDASAQDTRAAELERQRAEKARNLQTYQPTGLERTLLYVERVDPLRTIAPYNGFFVAYGYTDKPVGSGIALGAGYRHDILNRQARVELEGGISLRNYQLLRADFSLPYLADERVEVGVEATYRRHPQEDFYGIGLDSLRADRTSFLYDARDVQARAVARPARWLEVGARFGLLHPSVGTGTDSRFPTIQGVFDNADAPGLVRQPDLTYVELFSAIDNRDQPGNARAGGFYGIAMRRYDDRGSNQYGFRLTDADARHFFPIFDKKRVFAVRARAISTSAASGQDVPFYLMPTLGGATSLRSYSDYRFRDRNVMFINLEYRWEAFSGLDMALFSDWGKTAARARDLDLSGMKHAYGIGFRFNTHKAVFMRLDIAAGGGEGLRYFFKFSNSF